MDMKIVDFACDVKINEIKSDTLGVEVNKLIKARKEATKATLGDMEAKATSSIVAFL
jgi:hypothetical protein